MEVFFIVFIVFGVAAWALLLSGGADKLKLMEQRAALEKRRREFEASLASGEASRALATGVLDVDPAIRLMAATHLDDEAKGFETLLSVVKDVDADPEVIAAALDRLARRPESEAVVLRLLEGSRDVAVASAAARATARFRLVQAVTPLIVWLRDSHERAEPAADALGVLAAGADRALRAKAESALCERLLGAVARAAGLEPRPEEISARVACAVALGKIGTIESVPSLSEAARAGVFGGELVRAANAAIEAIQKRSAGEAATLSLVEPDGAGQLSLSRESAGTLAISEGSGRGDE